MRQVTPRKDSAKQAATARRLNASSAIAKHVIDQTFFDDRIDVPVIRCRAEQDFEKDNVVVKAGQQFFMVQSSKFKHYYYVVAWNEKKNCYQCSCGADCKQAHRHIEIVKAHALKLAVQAKAA